MKYPALFFLKAYKIVVSPILVVFVGGHACRFEKSCSQYSYESIKRHGFLRGITLSLSRISKCHPFS